MTKTRDKVAVPSAFASKALVETKRRFIFVLGSYLALACLAAIPMFFVSSIASHHPLALRAVAEGKASGPGVLLMAFRHHFGELILALFFSFLAYGVLAWALFESWICRICSLPSSFARTFGRFFRIALLLSPLLAVGAFVAFRGAKIATEASGALSINEQILFALLGALPGLLICHFVATASDLAKVFVARDRYFRDAANPKSEKSAKKLTARKASKLGLLNAASPRRWGFALIATIARLALLICFIALARGIHEGAGIVALLLWRHGVAFSRCAIRFYAVAGLTLSMEKLDTDAALGSDPLKDKSEID